MKIYISIPISGHDLTTQMSKASEIVEKIKALGHEPVNPFDTPLAPPGMTEKEKYAYYMGRDIEQLLLCDAVFFCEGWRGSDGCCLEFDTTRRYGIGRFVNIDDIPNADS